MNSNEKLSDHFTLGELIKSGTAERRGIDNTPPDNLLPNLKRLCMVVLEPIRSHYGRPMIPNSGYRSPELNEIIGGSTNSQHCKGEAVDIEVPGVTNYDLAVWISENMYFDQLILEYYRSGEPNSGWVHVSLMDIGNRFEILTWNYKDGYTKGLG